LTHILGLYRQIELAETAHDAAALREGAGLLHKAADEIGLVGIADIARDIGHAIDLGREEMALHDVLRLQQKVTATRSALARSFPNLSI
jgi:hypothetical protein